MAPHTSRSSASSTISSHRVEKVNQKKISPTEYVQKYTEYLVRGYKPHYALDLLLKVVCPYKVFDACLTEKVLEKHCSHQPELQYAVTLLTNKIADLRKKELARAKERMEKKGEMSADFAFNDEIIKMHQKKMDNVDQQETNQLFADVFKSVRSEATPKRSISRPDYSKFKIVKRSKPSTPSSGSPSSTKQFSISP